MPKQREKMTEVHSCGSPPFSTCLGAVASFIKEKVEQSGKSQQQYIIEALTQSNIVNTDGIKELLLLLILVHIVYVLIRWYVKGCMRSRGYY